MHWKRPHTALLLLLLLMSCIHSGEGVGGDICGQRTAAVVEITRGEKVMGTFSVAVADTPRRRREGLMHCPALAPETGMLFVYPNAGKRVFWMKNTVIELAIIFISADDRIVSVARGEPGSLEHIRSPDTIRMVLEVNYPESRRLAVGDRVSLRLGAGVGEDSAGRRP